MRWDMTLGEVFPDLVPQMQETWRTVTLDQLLTNRSGAPTGLDADGLWATLWSFDGTPTQARRALLEGVTKRAPEAEPGSKFIYSNAGFSIAGHMAETVTGTPYEQLLMDKVFAPLGCKSPGFGAPGAKDRADQPRGHRGKGGPVVPGAAKGAGEGGADNPPAIAPAGRLHLTIEDWAHYLSVHLREGDAAAKGSPALLKPETVARLHQPISNGKAADTLAKPDGYAMGWGVSTRPWAKGEKPGDVGRVLTHNGSNTMWFSVCWLAPERGFAVLIVCNQGGGGADKAVDEAAWAVIQGEIASRTPAINPDR